MCGTNLILYYKKVKFLNRSATKIVTKSPFFFENELNIQIAVVLAPTASRIITRNSYPGCKL